MKFCADSQYQLLGNLILILIGPVKYMFDVRLQQIVDSLKQVHCALYCGRCQTLDRMMINFRLKYFRTVEYSVQYKQKQSVRT